MEEKFYTVDQIAEILGMHHKTIRKFIKEGKLNANKVGKQWRISGHDLSLFTEKNNASMSDENINQNQGLEFSNIQKDVNIKNRKINVSTVVDINEIDIDGYTRISNTLIAVLNSRGSNMNNSTMNIKHYASENRLRVMLWGNSKFTEDMLNLISILAEPNDL